jgi:hypothetical protein
VGEFLGRLGELVGGRVDQVVAHGGHGGTDADVAMVHVLGGHRLRGALEVVAIHEDTARSHADGAHRWLVGDVEVKIEVRQVVDAGWDVAMGIPVDAHPLKRNIPAIRDHPGHRQDVLVIAFAFAALVDAPVSVQIEAASAPAVSRG